MLSTRVDPGFFFGRSTMGRQAKKSTPAVRNKFAVFIKTFFKVSKRIEKIHV